MQDNDLFGEVRDLAMEVEWSPEEFMNVISQRYYVARMSRYLAQGAGLLCNKVSDGDNR